MSHIETSSWLFVLQPSVSDHSGQRYEVANDSTWNQVCNVVSGIASWCPQVRITIAVPREQQLGPKSKDLRSQVTASVTDDVRFVPFEYAPSVRVSRAHFDAQAFAKVLDDTQYDFIWLSEPSHVLGVKTILLSNNRPNNTKILTSISWIDSVDQPKIDPRCSYFLRQVEGVLRSDAAIFNSVSAIEQFVGNVRLFFTSAVADTVRHRSHPIPPAFDPSLLGRIRPNREIRECLTIVFNHRLHGLQFYRSNWERVFDICKALLDDGLQFRVVATDGKTNEVAQRYPFIGFVDLGYREYIELLHNADIAAGLFPKVGMWSMALVEAMASGCATIVPRHSGYLELAPSDYPGFSAGTFDGDLQLMRKLVTDDKFRRVVADVGMRHVHEHFTNRTVSWRVLEMCERLQ